MAGPTGHGDPFAEGRVYPPTVEHWPNDDGPFEITFTWRVIDGRIDCSSINIASLDDTVPVPEGIWRDLRIGHRMRAARARMTTEAAATTGPPAGMRRSTWLRLKEAADVYREAFAAGRSPARAVEERFGLTEGGASALVARVRAAGLLPPTSPGAPQA